MKPIRISFKDLVYLHDSFINRSIPYVGPHYDLLREHVADFAAMYDRMIDRGSATYRLKFTSLQAKAFMLIWVGAPLPGHRGAYIIQEMIAVIDKSSKQPKRIPYENNRALAAGAT